MLHQLLVDCWECMCRPQGTARGNLLRAAPTMCHVLTVSSMGSHKREPIAAVWDPSSISHSHVLISFNVMKGHSQALLKPYRCWTFDDRTSTRRPLVFKEPTTRHLLDSEWSLPPQLEYRRPSRHASISGPCT